MEKIIHRANTRGHANHGWLNSYHTFSFANYYDPERIHFGVLRVLNDDTVAPGMGFGKHPHDNMEIISIPLYGDLEHEDSMGNKTVIREGDIQSMTAGTGVFHSEYNKNKDKEVRFLQIWVIPKKRNVSPSYDQISLSLEDRHNQFQQIVSPDANEPGVTINQDAWFHLAQMDRGKELTYRCKGEGTGVYVFVLEGEVNVNDTELARRDGLGLTETDTLKLRAISDTQVLLMEVPMRLPSINA